MKQTLKLMWQDPQNKILAVFITICLLIGIRGAITDGFKEVSIWIYSVLGISILWFILSYFSYKR